MKTESLMREIFEKYRTIAVCGMSRTPGKAAHAVPAYLYLKGYKIIPVNPSADEILGIKCYPSVKDVPEKIEILEVFRPSDQALNVVKEAVERKAERGDIEVIWLQEGIANDEAKELAEKAGIKFIQDKCMYKEFVKVFPDRE